MSRYTRSRHTKDSLSHAQPMLAKVQGEMAKHYVEVEMEGISLARLGCIYLAGAREVKDRMLTGVRSLLRLTPAH